MGQQISNQNLDAQRYFEPRDGMQVRGLSGVVANSNANPRSSINHLQQKRSNRINPTGITIMPAPESTGCPVICDSETRCMDLCSTTLRRGKDPSRVTGRELMTGSCCTRCKGGGACISKERFNSNHCCNSCRSGRLCDGVDKFVTGNNACTCVPGRCDCGYKPRRSGDAAMDRFAVNEYRNKRSGDAAMDRFAVNEYRNKRSGDAAMDRFVGVNGRREVCDVDCIRRGGISASNANANASKPQSQERFGNSAYYARVHGHHVPAESIGRVHWGLKPQSISYDNMPEAVDGKMYDNFQGLREEKYKESS
jgi:hypothetical protein